MNYTAEVFDQVMMLFNHTGWNDHQLHCELRFKSRLNASDPRGRQSSPPSRPSPSWARATPAKADAAMGKHRSRQVRGRLHPRCRKPNSMRPLTYPIDESTGPLVKVCLLDSDQPAVALTMSHMVSDAAGFKKYLYLLARDLFGDHGRPGIPARSVDRRQEHERGTLGFRRGSQGQVHAPAEKRE